MKKNRGSMVIEMTLLMPVFLGCLFLYVMLFVELIHLQHKMEQAAEILYAAEVPEYLAKGTAKTGSNMVDGSTSGITGNPLYADGGAGGIAGDSLCANETNSGIAGSLSYKDGMGSGAARGLSCRVKGDRREVRLEDPDGWFALQSQMEAGQGNPAKKLRRWQMLADML